jgi:DNA-binding GntR family transcriptional regulator
MIVAKASLSPHIAGRIVDHIRERQLVPGEHLASQALADAFRVSRAPVNEALKLLEKMKVVELRPNCGFFLQKDARDLRDFKLPTANGEDDETVYLAIADDRLRGKLPNRLSENEFIRIYDLSRSRLLRILNRIAQEGWIERRPGHGWEFRQILTSREGYEAGYRFRATIESAAVLEPGFRVDRAALALARARQSALMKGDTALVPRSELFRINSEFHEIVVGWSHNQFFIDSLARVNRLRRLIEYRLSVDRSRQKSICEEHLHILDLLQNGDVAKASTFLRKHIEDAMAVKSVRVG